jgi:hypothetical protein
LISPQKCLLHYFFRIMTVAGHAIRHAENVSAVPLHEDTISVTVARERPLDRYVVARGLGISCIYALSHPHD